MFQINDHQLSMDFHRRDTFFNSPFKNTKLRPFIKWAGGKRKLIPFILPLVPSKYSRYLEPFVGGGALALSLQHSPSLLNDSNQELILTYEIIKNQPDCLCNLLDWFSKENNESFFYNTRSQNVNDLSDIQKAARFIYLNKTAFNGLYRVNKEGKFNVPFGKNPNVILYDRENIFALSDFLKTTQLFSMDYLDFIKSYAKPGDLIYLDPPYHPVSMYSDFNRYTKNKFFENDQYKLAEIFDNLITIGAYPILSNSYSELTVSIYSKHIIHVVQAARNINKDSKGRGKILEIIVTPR